jgi:hypothetical protein
MRQLAEVPDSRFGHLSALLSGDAATIAAFTAAERSASIVPEHKRRAGMRKFIIERELPAIGSAERQALREAAQKSNATLKELGSDIQWVESYVAADKTFCVYLARDEAIIHEHARKSGFPANKITEIRRMIDPTTATEA